MIYLAESGSTKTDAVILKDDGGEVCRVNSMGFNPYFHSSELIGSELKKIDTLRDYASQITQVYFYGSGCSSPKLCEVVRKGLQMVFPNVESIDVDHDLRACAYATYSGEPAISCILGTGSNSVYFDGEKASGCQSGLGFILGDEGSASYIGKKLLTSYFYRKMPESYRTVFEKTYSISRDQVVKMVYQNDFANVYLASFAPFASRNVHHDFFKNLVRDGFRDFVEYHVICFPQSHKVPVHFVGSIAYHFQDILKEVCDDFGIELGQVIQKPLEGLISYHRNYILNSDKPVKSV